MGKDGASDRALVFTTSFAHAVWYDAGQEPPLALSPLLASMEGDPLDAKCIGELDKKKRCCLFV